MLAVDSSALIAILNREPEGPQFLDALHGGRAIIGWPTVFETRIWSLRRSDHGRSVWLEAFLDGVAQAVAFDGELERLAASAYERFGKGRHPAALNFGDAMTYAVAVRHDAPLLFKGSDFGKTDVKVHRGSVALG